MYVYILYINLQKYVVYYALYTTYICKMKRMGRQKQCFKHPVSVARGNFTLNAIHCLKESDVFIYCIYLYNLYIMYINK